MVDKMMRMAGRGTDGTAKALNIDSDGLLVTNLSQPISSYGKAEYDSELTRQPLSLEQKFVHQAKANLNTAGERTSGSIYTVDYDNVGNVYYTTSTDVVKLNANGVVIWKLPISRLHTNALFVRGLVVYDEKVYLTTSNTSGVNSHLVVINLNGGIISSYPMPQPEALNSAVDMTVVNGHIHIITRQNRYLKITLNGNILVNVLLDYIPVTLSVDNSSNVYVGLENATNLLLKLNSTGGVVWVTKHPSSMAIAYSILCKGAELYLLDAVSVKKINTITGAIERTYVYPQASNRFRLKDTENIYISTDNHLVKFDVDRFEEEYALEVEGQVKDLKGNGSEIYTYHQDGLVRRLDSRLKPSGAPLAKKTSDPIGNTVLNNSDKIKIYESYRGYKVVAMLHKNYFVQNNNGYFLLLGGWDVSPVKLTLPSGDLKWINFVEDRYTWWDTRYRLVANIGEKIYHNYADSSQSDPKIWAESDVWGLPNTLHPTDTTTKLYNNKARPRYYIPQTATDVFNYMGGMQHFRVASDINPDYHYQDSLWFATYSQTATPATVFMTKNGKDIYAEYMYGINPQPNRIGKDIDLSAIVGTIPSDLSLRKITAIIPNATNKEPVEVFDVSPEVSVTSMTYASNKTVVTAPLHGLKTGDIIYFKSATSQNNNNWLKPTSYANLLNNVVYKLWMGTNDLPLGNGKVYQVVKLTNDTFNLHEAVGNPHNHLHCTHIHSLDVVPNGIVISTGESGVLSNITFLGTPSTLSYLPANQQRIFADYAQLHLTANPVEDITGSVQRPLGFYMEEDFYLFASDEQTYRRPVDLPEGRTGAFNFRSSGIYKGKLSEIDDWSKAKVVLQPQFVAFLFKKIGDVFITSDVSGDTYFSVDKGDNWKKLYTFPHTITKYGGASADSTEFVINDYYFKVY